MEKKALSEMTLEELWQLFPIVLSEHRDCWEEWYREEADRLLQLLPPGKAVLHHVGSTAIGGIRAKPIIDILLEIPRDCSMQEIKALLLRGGYTSAKTGFISKYTALAREQYGNRYAPPEPRGGV